MQKVTAQKKWTPIDERNPEHYIRVIADFESKQTEVMAEQTTIDGHGE